MSRWRWPRPVRRRGRGPEVSAPQRPVVPPRSQASGRWTSLAADDLLRPSWASPGRRGHVARTPDELRAARPPVYVKAPVGTASAGRAPGRRPRRGWPGSPTRFAEARPGWARWGAGAAPGGRGDCSWSRPCSSAVGWSAGGTPTHATPNWRRGNGATAQDQPAARAAAAAGLERLGRRAALARADSRSTSSRPATGPVVIDVINPRLGRTGQLPRPPGSTWFGAFLAVAAGDGLASGGVVRTVRVGVRTHPIPARRWPSVSGRRAVLSELGAVLARRRGIPRQPWRS